MFHLIMSLFYLGLLSCIIVCCDGYYLPHELSALSRKSCFGGLSPRNRRISLLSHPLSQEEIPLITALMEVIPTLKDRFFFPGHCGGEHAPKSFKKLYGTEILHFDLPELDGLDNIHCPEGPLLRALQLAAELFNANQSWFLVNGSTSGILSAILAAVQIHQRKLLAKDEPAPIEDQVSEVPISKAALKESKRSVMILGRDSHKASFDGLRLADCDGALLPCVQDSEFGVPLGVDFDSISKALDEYGSQVCGLLLTRPSYQGVMCSSSRLREIVSLCHGRGVPVIVDEAHGSHLRFLGRPDMLDALSCGADIVIQSSHKTLTAMSQAAMMHIGHRAFTYQSELPGGTIEPKVKNQGPRSPEGYQKVVPTIVREMENDDEYEYAMDSRSAVVCEVESENGMSESCIMVTSLAEAEVERRHERTELAAEVLHDCFSMLTTTSPNTVILASLDATRAQMASEGVAMIRAAAEAADEIRYELREQNLMRIGAEEESASGGVQLLDDSLAVGAHHRHVLRITEEKESSASSFSPSSSSSSSAPQEVPVKWLVDPLRLTVRFPGRAALDVDDKMCEERGIFCELNLQKCVSYGIPPGSSSRSLKTLRKALLKEGEEEIQEGSFEDEEEGAHMFSDVTYLHTDAAKSKKSVTVSLAGEGVAAVGRISAETICPYPPGIPVLIKGERVTVAHLASLALLRSGSDSRINGLGSGCTVTGSSDPSLQSIRIIVE